MVRVLAIVVLGFCISRAAALDAVGAIKKIDADNGIVYVHANGQDRTLALAKEVKFLGVDGKPLADGIRSKEFNEGAEVTISVQFADGKPMLHIMRLGNHLAPKKTKEDAKTATGKSTVGLKPLTEMTADEKYKGEDGGLYGVGKNEPPASHLAEATKETARIVPLGREGKPAPDGIIGFVSISMSNATQEFSRFKEIADKDAQKSSAVAIVDCAQGGQAMAQWVDPNAKAWTETDRRLNAAKVSPQQVQVAWIKLANVGPTGDLPVHGKQLERDTIAVIHNAKARFPNLRIAYLGSRIYAGYATSKLNPEPYAFEGAFVVRWLIKAQIAGSRELKFSGDNEKVKAPLLLWGPYFWGNGVVPRG